MKKLVFASNNKHKLQEIRDILQGKAEILSLENIGFNGEIPEEQDTLEGNAVQKASFVYELFGMDCFADDTGLEIDALSGEPGVYSARYAGPQCNFEDNIQKVLYKMRNISDRKARFRTVIALIEKSKTSFFDGVVEGEISEKKAGKNGFGYDPVFKPVGFNKTFAEMTFTEKNAISHRARAIDAFAAYILK